MSQAPADYSGLVLTSPLLADATPASRLIANVVSQTPGLCVSGTAYTVAFVAGDNLALHQALVRTPRGAVLVAACGSPSDHGVFGSILATAALQAGVAGLITDAFVRDVRDLCELGFPTYAAGRRPHQTTKLQPGRHGTKIALGGVTVDAGDLVCADDDGVVVVPAMHAERAVAAAADKQARDDAVLAQVRAGQTTLQALNLNSGTQETR